ncbi:hypothetical protein K402DRAFT_167551 [Aulographum hederae CBS 113979]|uniref:Uncharacterized protein n=1 Tax=Aulographum hederae CBS 113979 TaxID=1176131 RepID=A0A6G1GRC2_9PEZI|nr:hypothetical protein K402DRAFT_167551 [Aulographum hederae CBS 113979]
MLVPVFDFHRASRLWGFSTLSDLLSGGKKYQCGVWRRYLFCGGRPLDTMSAHDSDDDTEDSEDLESAFLCPQETPPPPVNSSYPSPFSPTPMAYYPFEHPETIAAPPISVYRESNQVTREQWRRVTDYLQSNEGGHSEDDMQEIFSIVQAHQPDLLCETGGDAFEVELDFDKVNQPVALLLLDFVNARNKPPPLSPLQNQGQLRLADRSQKLLQNTDRYPLTSDSLSISHDNFGDVYRPRMRNGEDQGIVGGCFRPMREHDWEMAATMYSTSTSEGRLDDETRFSDLKLQPEETTEKFMIEEGKWMFDSDYQLSEHDNFSHDVDWTYEPPDEGGDDEEFEDDVSMTYDDLEPMDEPQYEVPQDLLRQIEDSRDITLVGRHEDLRWSQDNQPDSLGHIMPPLIETPPEATIEHPLDENRVLRSSRNGRPLRHIPGLPYRVSEHVRGSTLARFNTWGASFVDVVARVMPHPIYPAGSPELVKIDRNIANSMSMRWQRYRAREGGLPRDGPKRKNSVPTKNEVDLYERPEVPQADGSPYLSPEMALFGLIWPYDDSDGSFMQPPTAPKHDIEVSQCPNHKNQPYVAPVPRDLTKNAAQMFALLGRAIPTVYHYMRSEGAFEGKPFPRLPHLADWERQKLMQLPRPAWWQTYESDSVQLAALLARLPQPIQGQLLKARGQPVPLRRGRREREDGESERLMRAGKRVKISHSRDDGGRSDGGVETKREDQN